MKSVVVSKPYEYEIVESDIPKITDDHDVLIQMKAAGVCGSDFHIFKGENPCSSYPLVLGHENVGVITEVGKAVTKVKPGDRVVIDLLITCGHCYQCSIGRENVCENVLVRGSGTDGGFREYFTAPEDDVYLLPDNLPFEDAVLIEPFAIGAHSVKRGRVTKDDTVFILGMGTIGSIILQTCKKVGAKVICCDVFEDRIETAKKFGADEVINSKTDNLVKKVNEFTDGKGVTVAFDAACFQGSLTLLLKPGIIRNAGRLVSLGFTTDPEAISQAMIDQRELDIIGSRMSCYQFERVARQMGEGAINLDGIVTHFIKFSDIDEVFNKIKHPDPSVKKMVILFE
ncbi:MAG: zinc-binding alcohol dehydrogenase family protein [Eubacteriales bacterium]